MSQHIVIIDYGMCNMNSVKNMIRHLGYDCTISEEIDVLENADKIILPGVGNFGEAMQRINNSGIRRALDQKVLIEKIPILGICLGMQLLTCDSEEGNCEGLCYINASTKRFNRNMWKEGQADLKIPHMGWDYIKISHGSDIVNGVSESDRFYFVHSYYVACNEPCNSVATTEYGIRFDSVILNENIVGVQFHPEKSLKYGMKILNNFLEKF